MLKIRAAVSEDYARVREFYDSLIDAMKDAEFKPGWEKGVYPSQAFLLRSIENGELYIGEADDGQIASCMVANHEYNDGYRNVRWSVDAADHELFIIHALGVHPAFSGQGIAKQMVQKMIECARAQQIKTIRLDVLEGNLPAERAYTKLGFVYRETIQMFYEDTGWTNFRLFEFIV